MLCFDQLRWANEQRQKEWDPTGILPREFRGLEMGGEAGEAMELVVDMLRTSIINNLIGVHSGRVMNFEKKFARERMGIRGSRATKEELEDELGDLIACADLLAMDAGIDLGEAVRRKFNKVSEKMGLEARLPSGDLEDASIAELTRIIGSPINETGTQTWPRKQERKNLLQVVKEKAGKMLRNASR